jgi:hypothetical protein
VLLAEFFFANHWVRTIGARFGRASRKMVGEEKLKQKNKTKLEQISPRIEE